MPIHGVHAISLLSQCHHLLKLGNWRCDYDPRLPPTAGASLVQLVIEHDHNPSLEHRVFGSNDKYPIHVFGHTWRRDRVLVPISSHSHMPIQFFTRPAASQRQSHHPPLSAPPVTAHSPSRTSSHVLPMPSPVSPLSSPSFHSTRLSSAGTVISSSHTVCQHIASSPIEFRHDPATVPLTCHIGDESTSRQHYWTRSPPTASAVTNALNGATRRVRLHDWYV